ncbi:hypothetical protein [Methylobacterium sp. JK268]
MAEQQDRDEADIHRAAALFGAVAANAFASLSFRLLRRLVDEPGFADDFATMADEIIGEVRDTRPPGYGAEQDADLHRQAVAELRAQFDEWLRQLRPSSER